MSLIHRMNPFFENERSFVNSPFFRNFENDDFFNYDDQSNNNNNGKNHHHLISKHHMHLPHLLHHHHHHQNSIDEMEKQMFKVFDKDVFKMVDFCPKINLSEDDTGYYIHADLPGMTKDEIKIELDDDERVLTISGERKIVNDHHSKDGEKKSKKHGGEEDHKKYSKVECCYGKFERSFTIPENANLESVQAKMDNGVLEMSINKIKPDSKQIHRIEIQ